MRLLGLFETFYYYFFYEKILYAPKNTKKHQKAQKRNQAKAQNANKQTKIENALKKHLSRKVTYSFICVFVFSVHAKKRK